MESSALACRQAWRRRHLFNHPRWNGVDFLEVSDAQGTLCVHFFGAIPEGIGIANVRIEGGRRIQGIRVLRVEIDRSDDPEKDDCLRIVLDKIGDFSTYRLCFVERIAQAEGRGAGAPRWGPFPGLDPRYACLEFRFRLDCPSELDCQVAAECPPAPFSAPEIDYLAKDYASLRQIMLDRMALTMPAWRERHVPDLGVTLVEVLAYTADYLSYYQDAVATEAYLDTARQRISVRRHVRLVDYRMHEGCNARAWITVDTDTNLGPLALADFYFITALAEFEGRAPKVLPHDALADFQGSAYEVFEPIARHGEAQASFRAAHSRMLFYSWGDSECCLPKGATRATLVDGPPLPDGGDADAAAVRVLDLRAGDVLVFEEVRSPVTGSEADADPAHRHAVLLTQVTPTVDWLLRQPVLEIAWAAGDALPFSLCLSARLASDADCARIGDLTVARGNVLLVDHGRRAGPDPLGKVPLHTKLGECACDGSVVETRSVPEPFRPILKQHSLTFKVPFQPAGSAAAMLAQDPRQALPDLALDEGAPGQDGRWSARYDLLASSGQDRHFVVEMDDERRAHLRFGDSEQGMQPAADASFDSHYRYGGGAAGNVGRDAIAHMVFRPGVLDSGRLAVRNPLPAAGGTEPEPVAEVKLFAPGALRKERMRAITAADYAELAQRNPAVQRAAAELSWTGSWYEARVVLDPLGTETAAPALLEQVEDALFPYRRIGHDLAVAPARYVPISLTLQVCVLPHFTRGEVRARLLQVLGNRRLANGELGLFHPDRLSFGGALQMSRIVGAAAAAVEGVERVWVRRFQRLDVPDDPLAATVAGDPAIADRVLALGPLQIARLDNDPDFPENGSLTLILGGGR